MRIALAVAMVWMMGPVRADTAIQTLVARVEASAAKEDPRMGLDTLVRGAERLWAVDPQAARHLLDAGLPVLAKQPPSSLTLRFMLVYASIDADGAEKAASAMRDKTGAYTALIDRAAEKNDFARVVRLVRRARGEGVYSSGAITFALQRMAAAPEQAKALLREEVETFPADRATENEVRGLLNYLSAFSAIDPAVGREAAHKLVEAIGRPEFRTSDPDVEQTAEYVIGGKHIRTETTSETDLLPSAAYLKFFDGAAFEARRRSWPAWASDLIIPNSIVLQNLAKTPILLKHTPVQPVIAARRFEPPDISKMSYGAALALTRTLELQYRFYVLQRLASNTAFTVEQRKAAIQELLPLIPGLDDQTRYYGMRSVCGDVCDSGLVDLCKMTLPHYLDTLDFAVNSQHSSLRGLLDQGELQRNFSQVDAQLELMNFTPEPLHPSVASRRLLRELDRAAYERADFTLATPEGEWIPFASLKGKIVLINFWHTGCEGCRNALPVFQKLHGELSSAGLAVLGISFDTGGAVRDYLARNGITYRTVLDPTRSVHDSLGVNQMSQGLPLTLVFDRDGKFVDKLVDLKEEKILSVLKRAGL